MDEESSDKLRRIEHHGCVAVLLLGPVVLPLKGNVVFIEVDESRVSDGDPVGVTREVLKHSLGSGERSSGIDIPFAVTKASDEAFEGARVLKRTELGKEVQALLAVEREEFIEEQTSKQCGEHFDVDEEVVTRGDPSLTIEGEAAAGDDKVRMGMMESTVTIPRSPNPILSAFTTATIRSTEASLKSSRRLVVQMER